MESCARCKQDGHVFTIWYQALRNWTGSEPQLRWRKMQLAAHAWGPHEFAGHLRHLQRHWPFQIDSPLADRFYGSKLPASLAQSLGPPCLRSFSLCLDLPAVAVAAVAVAVAVLAELQARFRRHLAEWAESLRPASP